MQPFHILQYSFTVGRILHQEGKMSRSEFEEKLKVWMPMKTDKETKEILYPLQVHKDIAWYTYINR